MDSAPIKSGRDALFMQICNKWGFKFFQSDEYHETQNAIEQVRNDNYTLQQQFSDLQLAPKIGKKIEFSVDKDLCVKTPLRNTYVCGFLTETVEVCGEAMEKYTPCDEGDYFRHERKFFANTKWGGLRRCLIEKLTDHHATDCWEEEWDLHSWNWGVDPTGEPVVIDFSRIMENGVGI